MSKHAPDFSCHPALKNKYRGYDADRDTVDHNYNWHDAIHAPNPAEAQEYFASLLIGSDMYFRRLLNLGRKPGKAAMDAEIARAVESFMARYRLSDARCE